MAKDIFFGFISFGILPRSIFLLSLCVLAMTYGFGVPQLPQPQQPPQSPLPQLPTDLSQPAKSPELANPQVSISTSPQPQQTTEPTPPQPTEPTEGNSAPFPTRPPPNPTSPQILPTDSLVPHLQPAPLQQQGHIPPISHPPSSVTLPINITESHSQHLVTPESITEINSLNSSEKNRPKVRLPHTAPPFLLVNQTLHHRVDQTAVTLPVGDPRVHHIDAPPSQQNAPPVVAKSTDLETEKPNPVGNIPPPHNSVGSGPPVTEPTRIFITEKLIHVPHQVTTPPPARVIQLFMGTVLVNCGNDPLMSCGGRCGQSPHSWSAQTSEDSIKEIMANGTRYTCMCDRHCVLYGDCCTDYFSLCEKLNTDEEIIDYIDFTQQNVMAPLSAQEQDPSQELHAARLNMVYGSCSETSLIYDEIQETHTIWMISKCPESYTDHFGGDIIQYCENGPKNPLFSYPVSIRWFSAPIFKNIFCAFCHQIPIEAILFWHEIFYCSKRWKGENDPDWSFQDVMDAADISADCPLKSGVTPPSDVEIRFCNTQNRNNSSPHYQTECQLDNARIDPTKEAAFAAACQSIFQPVWIPEVSAMFSSVHCALCSGIPESAVQLPSCQIVSSPPAKRQTGNRFAEVGYYKGHLTLDVHDSQFRKELLCSADVPQDYASIFVQKCPETKCPTSLEFSQRLTRMEMSCLVKMLRYPGHYWKHFPPTDLKSHPILFISKYVRHIHLPLTEELDYFSYGFRYALTKLCGDECSPEDLEFIFQSVSLNTQGEFHAEFFHRGSLSQIFPLMLTIDYDLGVFMFTPTIVTNYKRLDDVCPEDPTLAIRLFDVPLVVQNYEIYVYVDLWGRGCFFDLEQVGFSMEFVAANGPPMTVLTVILCWLEDMATSCNIPRPNTAEVSVVVDAHLPCDPNSKQGVLSHLSSQNATHIPTSPLANGSRSTFKENIILEETKVFKTVCFTTSAVALLFSATHNFISMPGSINLHMLLFFSLSKISFATCLTLYVVNANQAVTDEKLMAIFMHCGWILGSLSLAMSFKDFRFLRAKTDRDCSSQPNTATVLKQFAFTTVVCVIIVGLSVAVEEDSKTGEPIGYSSNSGRLFWMTNENGCYISNVAVIGVCCLGIFVKLGIETMKFRRSSLNLKSSISSTTTNYSKGDSGNLALHENSALITYFVHMFGMYLVAVADYVNENESFWGLMFCVASISIGIYLLAFLWKELVTKVCWNTNVLKRDGSIRSYNRYSTPPSPNLDGVPQSNLGSQVYKVEDDATVGNLTSVIYAPE